MADDCCNLACDLEEGGGDETPQLVLCFCLCSCAASATAYAWLLLIASAYASAVVPQKEGGNDFAIW